MTLQGRKLQAMRMVTAALAVAVFWTTSSSWASQQRFDLDDGPKTTADPSAVTSEALWPVPSRAQWAQIVMQKGNNAWPDAVFTDPEGRWQLIYPSTLTEQHGDALGRDRWFSYPGQPQILCGAMLTRGAFKGLGTNAVAEAPVALVRDPDAFIALVRHDGFPILNKRVVALATPPGEAGSAVQAVSFDQRGKVFELIGVDREVFVRHVLVSDGVDLLDVFCAAQPGQKGWVEKQALGAVRLTKTARVAR